LVEILTNFSFYVYFLAVLWLSGVPLYADENPITTSASKCDSPFFASVQIGEHSDFQPKRTRIRATAFALVDLIPNRTNISQNIRPVFSEKYKNFEKS